MIACLGIYRSTSKTALSLLHESKQTFAKAKICFTKCQQGNWCLRDQPTQGTWQWFLSEWSKDLLLVKSYTCTFLLTTPKFVLHLEQQSASFHSGAFSAENMASDSFSCGKALPVNETRTFLYISSILQIMYQKIRKYITCIYLFWVFNDFKQY